MEGAQAISTTLMSSGRRKELMAFSCVDVSPCRPEFSISLSKWKISPGEAAIAELKPPKISSAEHSAEQLRSNQLITLYPEL